MLKPGQPQGTAEYIARVQPERPMRSSSRCNLWIVFSILVLPVPCALRAQVPTSKAGASEEQLGERAYFQRRYQDALPHFLAAARAGNAEAYGYLGYMHAWGYGVSRNVDEAIAWYQKAVAAGGSQADRDQLNRLLAGRGSLMAWVPPPSAAQSNPSKAGASEEQLGERAYFQRRYQDALPHFLAAARAGNAEACSYLGYMYEWGRGVALDNATAAVWFRKSVAAGNTDDQAQLEDVLVRQSLQQAETSAPQQQTASVLQQEVSRDVTAGEQRFPGQAEEQLGERAYFQQRYQDALPHFLAAARAGNAEACSYLGYMYEWGRGVALDNATAAVWFRKSVAAGNTDDQAQLEDVLVRQSLQQVDVSAQQQAAASEEQNAQTASVAPSASPHPDAADDDHSSDSAAEWQQDHQDKIDELNQEIAEHEEQAQQDDADAQQAEAQASQNSGISGGYGAIANAVNSTLNSSLAQHDRDAAQQERQQAEEEREQLAELGAEQPPVGENNSEQINLTRMQTGMIDNGETIQGALNQAEANLHAAQQQRQAQQQVQASAQQIAQEVANGTLTPQQATQEIQQQAQQAAQQTGRVPSGSGTQAATSPASTISRKTVPEWIAFAFSTLADQANGFGGDGAWGVAVNPDSQTAINQSQVACVAHSRVPNWCGAGNGGHYATCSTPRMTSTWAALAISNDGSVLHWADGYAIGYQTESQADGQAMATCGKPACHVVWSADIDCTGNNGPIEVGGAGVQPSLCKPASGTYNVTGWGADAISVHTDLNAELTDAAGNASSTGSYLRVTRAASALAQPPVESFQPAGGVLDQIMPGQVETISVNPTNGQISVLFNVCWQ